MDTESGASCRLCVGSSQAVGVSGRSCWVATCNGRRSSAYHDALERIARLLAAKEERSGIKLRENLRRKEERGEKTSKESQGGSAKR